MFVYRAATPHTNGQAIVNGIFNGINHNSRLISQNKKAGQFAVYAALMMRKKNAKVLYNVFPRHIAQALSAGKKVEPEHHEMVSIFFSDIVGFTTIASSFSPIKVSHMLDRLYTALDTLATKHGVLKIETVGDSYMGVTNIGEDQSRDHVERIANFALDVQDAASQILIDVDDPDRGYVQLRIGFHSGPVVSNVIGSLNLKYGIFGDTVNTASRMESTGTVGKIQCSARSAMLLMEQAPHIALKSRGEISVKGKGVMTTYWVVGDTQHHTKKHTNKRKTFHLHEPKSNTSGAKTRPDEVTATRTE